MKGADDLDALLARKRRLESPSCQDADLPSCLRELRTWQSARLAKTYEDFHDDPRYSSALEFFVSDLYGPREFADRNRNLARAIRYLKRALPAALMKVLAQALELDVLTRELDNAMVHALTASPVNAATYAAAYRSVGQRASRARQIELIVSIGKDLSGIVSRAWIGRLLHAAHVPAHAAGFGVLQDFLERGHAAFRQMRDPERLLHAIQERETDFMTRMLRRGAA
ncbi:MAG: FFLEELY motif protein [Steroidobacteraceae bacterium]|jgi:hypothetical protein